MSVILAHFLETISLKILNNFQIDDKDSNIKNYKSEDALPKNMDKEAIAYRIRHQATQREEKVEWLVVQISKTCFGLFQIVLNTLVDRQILLGVELK